ncbi:MAG: hypothetical protein PHI98_04495 [Eubacteriales bacterium]|nr:hypothetical protein [Eubacteriales bacterium]
MIALYMVNSIIMTVFGASLYPKVFKWIIYGVGMGMVKLISGIVMLIYNIDSQWGIAGLVILVVATLIEAVYVFRLVIPEYVIRYNTLVENRYYELRKRQKTSNIERQYAEIKEKVEIDLHNSDISRSIEKGIPIANPSSKKTDHPYNEKTPKKSPSEEFAPNHTHSDTSESDAAADLSKPKLTPIDPSQKPSADTQPEIIRPGNKLDL